MDNQNSITFGLVKVFGWLVAIVFIIFTSLGAMSEIFKYLRTQTSHETLTNLRYHRERAIGEYRECYSMNLHGQDNKPDLECADSSPMDPERTFKVSFSGDVTYDSGKPDGAVHYWLWRRNDAEPSFSCRAKGIPAKEIPATEPQT